MTNRDYYEILGIAKNASTEDIKAAFRKLARQYHPDVSKEADAEEKFKEINEAYGILSDPEKRRRYDQFGRQGLGDMGGVNMHDYTMDFNDLVEELFGSFGFGFGNSTGSRSHRPRRGRDLQVGVQLAFEEAIFGVEKTIEITRNEVCSTCRGAGLERKVVKKVVSIPGGVDNGTQIRLAGEGEPGTLSGPQGNLYLVISAQGHKFFKRRENDILLNLDINLAQATLGAEIDVPTVEGKTEKLNIPAGTQPGKVFTLKGRGVPYLRKSGRGDELVIMNVDIPTRLTKEQRELFEKLATTLGTTVKPKEKGFLDWLNEALGG